MKGTRAHASITKYTSAGQALGEVLKKFIPTVTAGKKVLDLVIECVGGRLTRFPVLFPLALNDHGLMRPGVTSSLPRPLLLCGTRPRTVSRSPRVRVGCERTAHLVRPDNSPAGSAFPTSISVNNVVSHVSPLPSDPEVVLKEGDVVKIMLGIHLDGYAVTHAETVHLAKADSKTSDLAADVIQAAYDAAQVAMRTIKVGNKNWDVTEAVEKVAKDYGCSGVEGMLSCQHLKDVTDGKKRILLNPSPELKRDHETATFEEGEVYGVDILLVTGPDGKVSDGHPNG